MRIESRARGGLQGLALALVAMFAAACAAPVGSGSGLKPGDPSQVAAALAASKPTAPGPVNALGAPIVVALVGGPRGPSLVAFDLNAGRALWRVPAAARTRPSIGRDVLVYADASGALVAHDLASGRERWRERLPAEHVRLGHAADGDAVYEVLERAGAPAGKREGVVIARAAESGGVRWRLTLPGPLGGPVARGGVVAVPRQSQYVTLIGAGGKPLAEVLARDEAASYVVARPEGFFYGSRGVFPLTPEAAFGVHSAKGYRSASLPSFVPPAYGRDLYRPELAAPSALDRNRVLWRGGAEGGFRDGLVVVHAFRVFFGLDARSGAVRWAHNHPRVDAIASEHAGPTVVFVAADGEVGALDARSGQVVARGALGLAAGETVLGAAFDVDAFAGTTGAAAPADTVAALASIVWDPDRRLPAVKAMALEALAAERSPAAGEALWKALDADTSADLPDALADKAAEALVARKDRALLPRLIEALEVPHDYAEGRAPKRLDVLTRAVAALGAREAVPALVAHLRFPETPPSLVPDIAEAVLATGAPEGARPFAEYLLVYRADPDMAEHPSALRAAADVVLKLGGPAEKERLRFAADDPRTTPELAAYLKAALEAAAPADAPAEPDGPAGGADATPPGP